MAFGLVELLLWMANYPLTDFPEGMFQQDDQIGYHRLAPHFHGTVRSWEVNYQVETNAEGMRGAEVKPRAQVGRRILGLGDSFAFGVGVEDSATYLRQLERLLNASSKTSSSPIEVLNAGVPGYGTIHELRYLEHFGLRYKPEVVLLGFYIGNDLSDNDPQPMQTVQGFLVPQSGMRFVQVKIWLRRHLRTYAFLANTLKQQKHVGSFLARLGIVKLADPGMGISYPGVRFYLKQIPPEVETMWSKTEEFIVAMNELLQQHHSRLVVIAIPDRVSVYERWMLRAARQVGMSMDALDGAVPHRHLADLCRRHQIDFVDTLPAMQQAATTTPQLYFDYDGHWTAEGHRVAARAIWQFLTSSAWLSHEHQTVHSGTEAALTAPAPTFMSSVRAESHIPRPR